MGYLIYAIVFFVIYYFTEQKILKNSLIKAGKKYAEIYGSLKEIGQYDLIAIRKKTDFYKLQRDKMVFMSCDNTKSDMSISDLDYKDLEKFKIILENFKNGELSEYYFFTHKKYKHLIYPFFSDNGSLEIILLSTYNNTINEIFDRNTRKN